MSPAARERFVEEVLAYFNDPALAMSEGRPHQKARTQALDELSRHFKEMGREIYLADDLSVIYPGYDSFVPDILAVLDVPQPEDDERTAWIVADEGRGLDLVIEVLHLGKRDKDLTRNVELYAELGIREYFVFDRKQLKLHGFRLPGPTARAYQPIRPRLGKHASKVLGLDLAVIGKSLRFFAGHAELVGSEQIIDRLSKMMEEVEARADLAQSEAQQAQSRVEQAQSRAEQAISALRTSLLALLGPEAPAPLREHVAACADPARLGQALVGVSTRTLSPDELAALLA